MQIHAITKSTVTKPPAHRQLTTCRKLKNFSPLSEQKEMIAATDEQDSKITKGHKDSQNTQTLQNVQYLRENILESA